MGFVESGLSLLDARFRQTPIGQPLGQRLDEPHRRTAGQPHQPVRDGAIVDGKGQIVVSRCCPGIQPQNGVDDEFLAVALLVFPHAVPAEHAQPFQGYPVQAHPPSPADPAPPALSAAPALPADRAPASAPAPAAATTPEAGSARPAAPPPAPPPPT